MNEGGENPRGLLPWRSESDIQVLGDVSGPSSSVFPIVEGFWATPGSLAIHFRTYVSNLKFGGDIKQRGLILGKFSELAR